MKKVECALSGQEWPGGTKTTLARCAVESPSDCVHLLWRIRDFFPYDTCVCYEALAEVHYRPLFEPQVRTTPNYYYYYTTAAPRWDPRVYPTTPPQSRQYGYTQASDKREPVADERYSSSNQRWNVQQSSQVYFFVPYIQLIAESTHAGYV
ncbi:hypothetical protein TELCIR_17256, partial [Teladorsagia circumcincta]